MKIIRHIEGLKVGDEIWIVNFDNYSKHEVLEYEEQEIEKKYIGNNNEYTIYKIKTDKEDIFLRSEYRVDGNNIFRTEEEALKKVEYYIEYHERNIKKSKQYITNLKECK